MAYYSNPERETDPYTLPDVEVFQLTAQEIAELDEDVIHEFMKRREFRFAGMNGHDHERMLDAIIEEHCITGGWFFQFCLPGCLPDSDPMGPYDSHDEALAAARADGEVIFQEDN